MNASGNFPFRGLGGKIFLVGFMGSGKTHWGKLWADHYNLEFYNLDTIVEENEGMTINSIFHEKGEAHFRAAETKAH